jgi:hypothetical protein
VVSGEFLKVWYEFNFGKLPGYWRSKRVKDIVSEPCEVLSKKILDIRKSQS